MDWIGIQFIGLHCNAIGTSPRPGTVPDKTRKGSGGFHYNPFNATNQPEVSTMRNCIACGAELAPPARAAHTVYVKTLYRIGGQDYYCRHHIIRAAVAVGVIAEVKPGAGPVTTVTRGAPSEERFRPFQG